MARIALLDACVLYSAPLRDLMMRLAVARLFQPRWSDEIHDEWMRSILSDRPDDTRESLVRCRELMEEHVPFCLVTDFAWLIPSLTLPDPDDRHVLAAAIHGGAALIVTLNLADFPTSVLAGYSIEALHPDEFVCRLLDENRDGVISAMRLHRLALKKPPKDCGQYLATLEQCGLKETVAKLRSHAAEL
jgi:hypothetical protein